MFVVDGGGGFGIDSARFFLLAEEFVSSSPEQPRLRWLALTFLVAFSFASLSVAAAQARAGFTPPARMGFTSGDQWEPAIAADGYGHVFILYPQYGMVPSCSDCALPTMVLVASSDNGATWQSPQLLAPAASGQFDPQIVVDPLDQKTLYASWLQNKKRDVMVAKSSDSGQTWSVVVADSSSDEADKPVLSVRGQDVYVGFSHKQELWVTASHDAALTFASAQVNPKSRPGWSLAGGAAVDPAGNIYFAWANYALNGDHRDPVRLYVSKSADGGRTWTSSVLDVSGAPPGCAAYKCGWAYLGAQVTMASDAVGTLYALWNASAASKGPERIYFSSSSNGGGSWSPRIPVSQARPDVQHAFPAITANSAGDVRVAWMDSRANPRWNTYYRSSNDGGATWSAETQLSRYVPGYSYIQRDGFSFPFGDYFEMDVDSHGQTHAVWGEGRNYQSPGSIWYASGR